MHYTCSNEELGLWNQAAWISTLVWLFINCMNWAKDLFLTGWLLRQNEFLHQKCLNQCLICSKYQLTDTLDKY